MVKVNAIKLEETSYWNLDLIEGGDKIEKIWGVYIYEPESGTYCCSLFPSYWFEFIEHVFELKEEFKDDDELRSSIWEQLIESTIDDPSGYYDVSYIRWVIKNNPDMVVEDDTEHDCFDDAIEYHRSNGVF